MPCRHQVPAAGEPLGQNYTKQETWCDPDFVPLNYPMSVSHAGRAPGRLRLTPRGVVPPALGGGVLYASRFFQTVHDFSRVPSAPQWTVRLIQTLPVVMTITRQRVVRQQGLRAQWQENNGHFPVKPLYFLHFAERIHKPSATPAGSHGRWQWSQGAFWGPGETSY